MDLTAVEGRRSVDAPPAAPSPDALVTAVDARAERRLVREARAGSEAAMTALFRLHWPRAYRGAYAIVRDAAAAEDIAQEAFLAAVRHLDRFDRRRPFGPWLGRIVANRSIDWARARTLRREAGDEPLAHLASGPEAPARPYSDEVEAALNGLPDDHRTVIALRFVLEFTPGEIAELLGVPRGTVNSRLRRALDSLAQELPR